ncbi:hypothetical protein [Bogoriella caseilytica]|uniref:Uncharacterized protein n=1 Tax=Bogoriella caseilytica TaxID=56055 RepID=A0A3N2BD92_9MICO|nr:hypothetical protein [Bogoriella caseilytica]ROR73223.1 hypothetical protein EDD31_1596 [Bogoriella caseilytica]
MDHLIALVPSIGVGILLWIVLRGIINADRHERAAQQRFDEERAEKSARGDKTFPED